MATDINSCTFTGRLTRAPRYGKGPSGVAYIDIDIACNQGVYDPLSQSWVESTTYVDCVAFAELAEELRSMSLTMGTRVMVTGRLRMEPRMVPGTDIVYRRPVLVLSSCDPSAPREAPWKAGAWRNRTDPS